MFINFDKGIYIDKEIFIYLPLSKVYFFWRQKKQQVKRNKYKLFLHCSLDEGGAYEVILL